MTALFLQARLTSSRLPGKALLELGGRSVIDLAMDALSRIEADAYMVVTDERSAGVIAPHARRRGFALYAGSSHDVLDRYVQAARRVGASTVIRATADNPLVSPWVGRETIARHAAAQADHTILLGMPLGSGVEVVSRSALESAWAESNEDYDREHVTPFIYHRPERFRLVREPVPPELRCDVPVTLDTLEDYRLLSRIYADLYHGDPIELEALVGWLRSVGCLATGTA